MCAKLTNKVISEVGVKEKYLRDNHYNTLKVWWARRPITAARNLLIQEILRRSNDENADIKNEILLEVNPDKKEFKRFAQKYNTENFAVLDVFAGGGSIPFESARLGCKTTAAELNPVASLLHETIFNSQSIEGYPDLLRNAGGSILKRVQSRVCDLYKIGQITPYVIFWSKVARCKSCGFDLDLRRFTFFSKRANKPIRISEDESGFHLSFSEGDDERNSSFTCKQCGTSHSTRDIKDFCSREQFKHTPFGMCYHQDKKKLYKLLSEEELQFFQRSDVEINERLDRLSWLIPQESVKEKSGVINPTIYDLKQHKDFFSKRQLLLLLTLIDETIHEYKDLEKRLGLAVAKQVILGLTSLVEFLVDWNSLANMWIPQNEQTGRSLAGPGVGMKWDFIEINPFYPSGSTLISKLERVCDTFEAIKFENKIQIVKGSSAKLPLPDASIDIVLTDPPYYDSVDYTGLSEFFRPWFEVILRNTYEPKANLKNQDQFEAIVELTKSSGKQKDHNHYKQIMTEVLLEVNRVMKDNGSCLLMYSHKTIEGWSVIADAFREAGLFIDLCIPLEMERIARPRAMSYEALNGVIVFRSTKISHNIRSVSSDIERIKIMLSEGELLESQIVIYLAGLACKESTLKNLPFLECYESVIKQYQHISIEKWLRNQMDDVTVAYLEGRLTSEYLLLEDDFKAILETHDLVYEGGVKGLEEITIKNGLGSTLLAESISLYNEFKYNSKTKAFVDSQRKESLLAFFSIISGSQLNTVSKRSSSPEVKTARLILSKLA